MDLNTMMIFARVAENQSFTRAAKELGVEKSTVSSKIIELENRLGTRLLNRNTRSVALTEAGEGYFRYCQQVVENAMEADDFVKTFNTEPQGLLRVSGPLGIGRILIKDILGSFLKQYPKISVDIRLDTKVVDLVRERYDIALRVSNSGITDPALTTHHLADIKLGFYTTADYRASQGGIKNLAALEKLPIIHPFSPPGRDLSLFKDNKKYHPNYRSRIIINNVEACISAINSGLGIGILPSSAVKDEIASGRFCQVLPEYRLATTALFAVFPNRHWQPSKLQVFLQFLEEWGKAYREL